MSCVPYLSCVHSLDWPLELNILVCYRYMAAEVEIRMLREQLNSLGVDPKAHEAQRDTAEFQDRLHELERENQGLSQQLAEERHNKKILQEAFQEKLTETTPASGSADGLFSICLSALLDLNQSCNFAADYSAKLFESVIEEKRGIEEAFDKVKCLF